MGQAVVSHWFPLKMGIPSDVDKLVVIPENPYRLYIRDKLYYGAGGSFLLVSLENGDSLGCG